MALKLRVTSTMAAVDMACAVEPWHTVADVKAKVEQHEEVSAHPCCLAYNGKELANGRTLVSYKPDTRTALQLVPRNSELCE